jgi:HAD superfamily hydrolase (TIGR01509 family)
MTEVEILAAARERLQVTDALFDRFWAELWREYLGSLNVELYEWFTRLRPSVRTGILSNSFVGAREREQQLYGFAEHADLLVYSHEVGLSKPDPALYELTSRLLGVAPRDIVFVDDTPAMVDGARAAGWRAVIFQNTTQVIAEVTSLLDS